MAIRTARVEDAARLAEFAEQIYRYTFAAHNNPSDLEMYLGQTYGEAHQRRELSDPAIITLVSEQDGAMNGFAQMRMGSAPQCVPGRTPIEISRFYVHQDWHGHGIAQEMMRAVEAIAREKGADTIWLGVWERNDRAMAFYAKCGFSRVGSKPFIVGTDLQTDYVVMRVIPR